MPFVKGQSGNPGGRRKGQQLITNNAAAEFRKHTKTALQSLYALDAFLQRIVAKLTKPESSHARP